MFFVETKALGGRGGRRTAAVALGMMWMLVHCSFGASPANLPLAELEAKLRQMQPSRVPLEEMAGPVTRDSVDPHDIVRREWLVLTAPRPAPAPFPRTSQLAAMPSDLLRAVRASVRVITPRQQGAGFLISARGDVVTSYHTLIGAETITVQTLDGRLRRVEGVRAFSALHDLAILRIAGEHFDFLPLHAAPPEMWPTSARVLGHPRDQLWSVTTGRVLRTRVDQGVPVLHLDVASKRGASGGPILTPEGTVCGIISCAATLADGSQVTVGIRADVVQSLLARPEAPMPLDAFLARQRHIQATAFFALLTRLSGWSADEMEKSLSAIRLSAATSLPRAAVIVRQAGTTAAPAAQLLLLRVLAEQGVAFLDPASDARAGACDLLQALDGYLDCLREANRLHGRSLSDTAVTIERLLQRNRSARQALRAAEAAFAREFRRNPWPGKGLAPIEADQSA